MDFQQDFSAPYGQAEQLSPLITRILCENPSPYTYTGTGTYMVGNREKLAVIDPGPADGKHGAAILAAAGKRQISHIFVTHSHMDHSPLSGWLAAKTGAPVYAFGPHGTGRKAGMDRVVVEAGADKAFMPDTRLTDGEIIQGDGWTIKALHTPGHTANHMCFTLVEENTMFVGDHIMGWATTVISPPDGDMRDYLDSLKKVAEEGPLRLAPTHGPWVNNPGPFIRGIITHRRMREGQILKQLEDGPHTINILVKRMYKDVDKRLLGAAALSVLGHLIALVEEGRVHCDGKAELSDKFSLPET